MSDPCDFLTPEPRPVSDPDLHQRVLSRTLGVLRRRRWLRRTARAAALAACYGAGVATTFWIRPSPSPTPRAVVHVDPAPPAAIVTPPTRVAETDRARALVEAADRVLAENADPLTALHGYAKALDEGGPSSLSVSTDDSFLMMAIKDARKKENRDAKTLD